ncbi:MAG: M42 family metallopeptidase [Eubacteriales bacterium]|nr:M42 family metallopeptidase [Eubacteriales bacterium]
MDFTQYGPFILEETAALLAIDSPSGMTKTAAEHVAARFAALGYEAKCTIKRGVFVNLGGKDKENAILLEAHLDTLGGMVCEVKANGRLKITPVGGLRAQNIETENCRVITKSGAVIEGTAQIENASVHVNGKYNDVQRTFDTIEIVLDEPVGTAEETKALGVQAGDYVCFDPRTRITDNGYIKSRFLDDKLSVGIVLAYAKYLRDAQITPERAVYVHVTAYEEVGHGGSAGVPQGVTEAIAVDMGCVGEGLTCDERKVSICAKDSSGPFDYEVVCGLIAAAQKMDAAYAVDVYPHYSSDVATTLRAGNDVRHGLIGAGVYASHGYERSHVDGAVAALKVLAGYIE